ncbi:MAG: hypothetical protein P8Z79_17825 [Sedimentisphaerales bacterium]|jgi:hypothetical protein
MCVLKLVWKTFCQLWGPCGPTTGVIDAHKWESKVEVFKNLSSRKR